jgi:hypothetical protein
MKGRPPLEPRIAKLENEFKRLQDELDQMRQKFALQPTVPRETYQPIFARWPGNGGADIAPSSVNQLVK